VDDVANWDCWGACGEMKHVNRPVPSSAPEEAIQQLLSKARFVFGDQDWSAWSWEAREYAGTGRTPRTIRFRYAAGVFVCVKS
jgi:hypothetical protein